MNKILASALACIAMCTWTLSSAQAGAILEITDDADLEVGFRLQTLSIFTEEDRDDDGDFESSQEFKVRRARLRLKLDVTDWVTGFIQTESAEDTGAGSDMRVIDAFVTVKPSRWSHLVMGEHMAPASRQNLTSSGALLAIDRPGMNYKTLTWGTRSVSRFATTTIADSDAGLRGDSDVRDEGATLFGSGPLTETAHVKYYLGVYDGIQAPGADDERFTGRVQLNLFDPEDKYFNLATYLSKKKTVAIGASYDMQDSVGEGPVKGQFDYRFYTVDLFAEWPLGPGTVTFETAYQNLDLDDAQPLELEDGTTSTANPSQSQGDGFYVQAGYYWNQWQPWVEYESWDSDGEGDKGSYDMYRAGLSYFIAGHNANIKVGYERLEADAPLQMTNEDTINTVVLGLYMTY